MSFASRRCVIDGRHVLVVEGDLDLSNVGSFLDALTRLVGDSAGTTAVVDLDAAQSVDDTALGLLLGAAGRARTGGGDLTVVCTAPRLRGHLAMTGFDGAVRVAATVHAA